MVVWRCASYGNCQFCVRNVFHGICAMFLMYRSTCSYTHMSQGVRSVSCGLCTSYRHSSSLAATKNILDGELGKIKEAGTWKSERVIITAQGPTIQVQGQTANILNFCANNYLGLSVCVYCVCVCVCTLLYIIKSSKIKYVK